MIYFIFSKTLIHVTLLVKALTISGFDLEQIDEDVEDNFSILVVLFYNNHLILNAEKYHLSGYQYKAIIQSADASL